MVEGIQQDEQFWQAVWDGLSSHIALVDDQGLIVAVNHAWRSFALENGLSARQSFLGVNYLRICESATGPWAEEALPFARGLLGVLRGELPRFELEYPCHSPERERWFIARVTPLPNPRWRGVLVAHENITQRKQAEEATRASELLVRGLFEHALSGIALHQVVTDAAGVPVDYVFLRVNPAFEAHTGLSAASVLGRRVTEVLPGAGTAPFIETYGQVALTGRPARFETWVESLERHFQIEAYSPAQGQFATVFTDITDRKRIEEARLFLAQCGSAAPPEDFFQSLARYLARSLGADFVCIDRLVEQGLSAQTVAVFFDGKFADNVTYALQDTPCGAVVGKKHICCYPKDVRRLFPRDAVLQDMRAEGYAGTILWGHEGTPIGLIALIWRRPLQNAESIKSLLELVAVRAAGELERRQAEEALRLEHAQASQYLDIAGVMLVGIAPDQTMNLLNRKGCELLGYAPEELIGCNWFDRFLPERERAKTKGMFERLLRGELAEFEYVESAVMTRSGEERVIAWHNSLVRDVDGRITGTLSSGEDITERQRAEAEREILARAFERKNRELESLVYATSHDLRSPLLNVQGFSRRIEALCGELQSKLPAVEPAGLRETLVSITGERMQKSLRFILAGVDKMDRLINGLLRLSRLGRDGLHLETLNLDSLWRDILAVQAFAIQSAEAVITVAPLPPCLGDATLVNQLFSNLLDNALKYRDPARPLRVSVTGRVEGKRAVYCVADNGVGIAPEQQDRIWEVFHRVRPEDAVSGEGLGLSLVRRMAERHQGDAWVESTPGEGSRFFVALPHSSA